MKFTIVSLFVAAGPALVAAQAGAFVAITGYDSVGCYDEPLGQRALNVPSADETFMTPALCATTCAGYTYFGVEYGIECYCGNTLSGGALEPDASKCDVACVGDQTQNCGGHGTLSMYVLNGNTIPDPPIVSSSTVATSTIASTSTITPLSSSSTFSSSVIVVANVPSSTAVVTSSSLIVKSTSLVASTTFKISTSMKTSSTIAALATGFGYVGCFKDKGNMVTITKAANMNPSICIAAAKAKATGAKPKTYIYVGVEAGSICVGATKEPTKPTSLTGAKACTSTCVGAGNAAQTCGGKVQYNLYASVTGSAFAAPVKTKAA